MRVMLMAKRRKPSAETKAEGMTTPQKPAVLIVGGGLAGLTCARELLRRGITPLVLEAGDDVGGRVRSDRVDGFVLDRGFQVLFEAYPAARRQLDLPALDLRCFDPGAIICVDGRRAVLTDPLRDRDPNALVSAALSGIVSPLDKLRTLRLALELRGQAIHALLAGDDQPSVAYLRQRGFGQRLIDVFFRPFYGGIFLDRSLGTSAKCLRFNFKMLSEGRTCVPAQGMGAINAQLAGALGERGLIRTCSPVEGLIEQDGRVVGVRVGGGAGSLSGQSQELRAQAVVVATPAPEAARLTGLAMPQGFVGTTTLYFAGSRRIYEGKKLVLNAAGGLINNAQLLTNVAPEYAPEGRHLLSVTVLGVPEQSDAELGVAVMRELRSLFAGDVWAENALGSYYLLRVYRILYAQFAQPPGIHPRLPGNRSGRAGLYFAGEFTEASSLNAAMISGEKCAELVSAALTRG
jgi:phytoene dehydrogenase-like protein